MEPSAEAADTQKAAASHPWDGQHYPYRPDSSAGLPASVPFDRDVEPELDPITFEVLSNRLWNINEEHADTICRVSASPVVVESYDFNTCIQIEDGTAFLFAPYIQYFTGAAELVIKYTLENRADNPGIKPGDIFISNDPMIAGSHQMDVAVYAPVFVNGRLFCWVFNSCHARDVGGVEPGGFCVQAPDRYHEAPALRAMKLGDESGIRTDVEDTFLHFSRIPDTLALELRSQVAGISRARERVEELCTQYGTPTVKAAMHKLLDDTESAVSARLNTLPDGRWSEVAYVGGALPGDRDVHKLQLNLEKSGDQLTFDNYGTDPQVGSINCHYGHFRAAIGCALASTLAYEHRYCIGGVNRLTTIDAEVGTITAANRDGAITSTQAQLHTIFMATKVLSKMVYPDPEQRGAAMAASAVCSSGLMGLSGTDQNGNPFASITLDFTAGGIGAFTFRDGIDQGGTTFWPKSEVPDVEAYEQFYPVLYLYRMGARNCGHGKFRGGNGVVLALTGHRTDNQVGSTISIASSITTEAGLSGGHWGDTCSFYGIEGSTLRDEIAAGALPATPQEIRDLQASASRRLPAKVVGHPMLTNDIMEIAVFGGGGYGDPLERDPDHVATDVASELIRPNLARSVYGVVLGDRGEPDLAATERLRDEMRKARLGQAEVTARYEQPPEPPALDAALEIAEALAITRSEDRAVIACRRCRHVLCDSESTYKDYCARIDGQLIELDPDVYIHPSFDIDREVVYRMFLCPGCGTLLENELTPAEEDPFCDISIDSAWLSSRERIGVGT